MIAARRLGVVVAFVSLALSGCDEEAPAGPSEALVEDVRALQMAVATDEAAGPLREVDDAVLADLPVRAAQLVEAGAIPAARRQVERVEALEMRTDRGAALRERALGIYRDRIEALDTYREALERGPVEDFQLTEALRVQREVETRLLELHADLDAIRP